jgi:hypothetical protein
MNNKQVDRKYLAGLIIFVVIGAAILITGLFFGSYFDAYYANTNGIGIMAGAHAVIRKFGYTPVSVVTGLAILVGSLLQICNKKYIVDTDDICADKPAVY